MKAKGAFEVELRPLDSSIGHGKGATIGRMVFDKSYRGDLAARGHGEMLTVTTEVAGSAGYVAVEKVEGTLQGRSGAFILQHFGIMSGGKNRLILEVVPHSGTGDLSGISGKMEILMEDGGHAYDLDFTLE